MLRAKKYSFILILALLAVACAVACSSVFAPSRTACAADDVIYISSESDFVNFYTTCAVTLSGGKKYVLTTDIYLGRYFDSIGEMPEELPFAGELDGNGHAIVGYTGTHSFFGSISSGAVVKNLKFIGANVTANVDDGIFVKYNYGTIQSLTVTGSASGTSIVGIAEYNYGTISDSVAIVDLSGDTVAAIALVNRNSGTISGTRHPSSDGYVGVVSDEGEYVSPEEDLIADQEISDYPELLWYLRYYIDCKANDITPNQATQTNYINLYNTPLESGVTGALTALSAGKGELILNYTGYYNATRVLGADVISDYSGAQSAQAVTAMEPSELKGSGTSSDPYVINEVSELAVIGSLDGAPYVKLGCDIDLWYVAGTFFKPEGTAWIETFNGTFDGNGYTVSGLLGTQLFGNIASGATVKNLTVIGTSSGALLGNTVSGAVSDITVKGSAPYAIGTLNGSLSYADVDISGAVISTSGADSSIYHVRNYGESFVKDLALGTVSDSLNISSTSTSTFNANARNSVCFAEDTVTYTQDTDVYSLVTLDKTDSFKLCTTGWTFGKACGWGYPVSGGANDIPALVFPSDNIDYKKVSSFPTGATAQGVYGDSVRTDTIAVDPDSSGNLTKTSVEELILDVVPYSVRKALEADAVSFKWYRSNGTEHKDAAFDYAAGDSELEVYLETDYYYVTGLLTIDSGNVGNLTYTCVRYGMDSVYLEEKFKFNSLRVTFMDVFGFTEKSIDGDNYALYGDYYLAFDGVTIELFKGDEPLNGFVTTEGEYTMRVTVAPASECTGARFIGKYTVTKGKIDLDGYKVASSLGGLDEDSALEYVGAGSTFNPTFTLASLRRKGVSYSYSVESLLRSNGTTESWNYISEAGEYTVTLRVSVSGYLPYDREFKFYVKRKNVTVSPTLGSENIAFGGDCPDVYYRSALGDDAATRSILGGLYYVTDYVKYSAAGTQYAVSVRADESKMSLNYTVTPGTDAYFTVKPVDIDYTECGFFSSEIVYDGAAHVVAVDTSAFKLVSGDSHTYTYTITYSYNGTEQSEPFKFTSAGEYANLTAVVTPNTKNYNAFTIRGVTLSVKPVSVKVIASDVKVNYNEQAVYTASIVRSDGIADIAEVYEEQVVLGRDFTLTSDYQPGTQAGTTHAISVEVINERVGNYLITDTVGGTLSVGKKSYALNVSTEYLYTGDPVKLDFNGEEPVMQEGYPKYYYVTGGVAYAMEGAPIDVNDATRIYRAEIKTQETDEYYAGSKTVDFNITSIDFDGGNVYIFNNNQKVAFNGDYTATYNGIGYYIDVDRSALPEGASFVWSYTYEIYSDGKWVEETVESSAPSFNEPVKIRNVVITAKDNRHNYKDYSVLSAQGAVFTVTAREIKHVTPDALYYKEKNYTVEELINIINVLGYEEGYAPLENDADKIKYDVTISAPIINPGEYTVKVTSNNSCYATEDVTFEIQAYKHKINLTGTSAFEYDYGVLVSGLGSAPHFTYNVTVELGGESVDKSVTLRVKCADHQNSYIAPGTYDIVSADPYMSDGVKCIEYEVIGGKDKVTVSPKTVTFDWSNISPDLNYNGILSEYEYGSVGTLYTSVPSGKTQGVVGRDDPQITISSDRTVKHAGEYTFTAVAGKTIQGEEFDEYGTPKQVACYVIDESVRTFKVTVKQKQILYSIESVAVYVDEGVPTTFTAQYDGADENATTEFSVEDYTVGAVGEFYVTMSLYNTDGGVRYNDYLTVKSDSTTKELKISLHNFSGISVAKDTKTTYNGAPVIVAVEGAPNGATITHSLTPTNAGEYDITVTVSMSYYADYVGSAHVVISKATPYIVKSEVKREYIADHVMTDDDIVGAEAVFGDDNVKVEGTFGFTLTNPPQTLVYGKHTYKITFTPQDKTNFDAVNVNYVIETYVVEEECTVDIGVVKDGVVSGNGKVTFKAELKEEYVGGVMLYINGVEIPSGVYEFTSSVSGVTIELRSGDEVLFSQVVDVEVAENSDTDDSGKTDDKGSSGKTEDKTETGGNTKTEGGTKLEVLDKTKLRNAIIITASVVAVVVAVIVAVVVVKKKKEKRK